MIISVLIASAFIGLALVVLVQGKWTSGDSWFVAIFASAVMAMVIGHYITQIDWSVKREAEEYWGRHRLERPRAHISRFLSMASRVRIGTGSLWPSKPPNISRAYSRTA